MIGYSVGSQLIEELEKNMAVIDDTNGVISAPLTPAYSTYSLPVSAIWLTALTNWLLQCT